MRSARAVFSPTNSEKAKGVHPNRIDRGYTPKRKEEQGRVHPMKIRLEYFTTKAEYSLPERQFSKVEICIEGEWIRNARNIIYLRTKTE